MSLSSESASPPVTVHQTSSGALPSLGKHKDVLLQLKVTVEATTTKLGEFVCVDGLAVSRQGVTGGGDDDGDPDELTTVRSQGEWERLRVEAENIGREVEGALVEAEPIWGCLAGWRTKMEELAMGAAQSLQDKKRAKAELEELIKDKERLEAEGSRLAKDLNKVVTEAIRTEVGSSDPLWVEADRLCQAIKGTDAEKKQARAGAENVGKQLDMAAQETEMLILELEKVLSERGKMETDARRSVAEMQRLAVETERLKGKVDQVRLEKDLEKAPRD